MKFKTSCLLALTLFAGNVFLAAPAGAQQPKKRSVTIIITDGDTVVNGKHVNTLSQVEKEELMKDFPSMQRGKWGLGGTGIIADGHGPRLILRGDSVIFRSFGLDSLFTGMRLPLDSLRLRRGVPWGFNARIPAELMPLREGDVFDRERPLRLGVNPRNSQSFAFSSTDKDGTTTRMNFRVSDADAANELELGDLTLVPNFSAGKVTVSFDLPTKGVTIVQLLDADKKVIFSEKVLNFNGSFSKTAPFAKNGVYYLNVSQGAKTASKKIVKQN